MSDALTSVKTNGQHLELLSTHTINEQHVELLPARNCLGIVDSALNAAHVLTGIGVFNTLANAV